VVDGRQVVLTPGWSDVPAVVEVRWDIVDWEHSEVREHGTVRGRPYQTALACMVMAVHQAYRHLEAFHR
jgi:hypothetical protein